MYSQKGHFDGKNIQTTIESFKTSQPAQHWLNQ